jgi:hypothetical protein
MKYFIGDTVIPLSNPFNIMSQKREKGVPSKVTDILYCATTGKQLLNVDDNVCVTGSDFIHCSCGQPHLNRGLSWTDASEFVKGGDIKEALKIAEANEDWDLAIMLRDLKI